MIEERTLTDRQIAERATIQSFFNCYLRETGAGELAEASRSGVPGIAPDRLIRCTLPRQGLEVLAPLRYWSPTGRHLFRFPLYYRPAGGAELLDLDYATLAALTIKELEFERGGRGDELLLRVIDSCCNVERFVRARRGDEERLRALESNFIEMEQALVFGYHLHPTPKSRQGIAEEDL